MFSLSGKAFWYPFYTSCVHWCIAFLFISMISFCLLIKKDCGCAALVCPVLLVKNNNFYYPWWLGSVGSL